MNVLIVCQAGNGIGLGHLTRSILVAHSMQQKFGASIKFLVQGESVKQGYLRGFEHQFLEGDKGLPFLIREQVELHDIQIVVFDLYSQQIPEKFGDLLTELRQDNRKLISIDGLIDFHDKLDLIFIPSFNFTPPTDLNIKTPVLFGWDSYLLNIKRGHVDWKPGKRVLVLTGGSDTTNLAKTLPTLMDTALPDFTKLHWVTGPYAINPVRPDPQKLEMINHQAPSGLDDLMLKSNYALTVYGVSFFELLYYGIPTVVFSPYGNKDDAELAVIEAEGITLVARDEFDAINKLKRLMLDDTLAASLSKKSIQKMSVCGGKKFVQAVSELVVHE
jgi:spore coat polysaccharide biosynthesis predicted glycosyltransferase SpsG